MKTKIVSFVILILLFAMKIHAKEINIATIKFQIEDDLEIYNSDAFLFHAEKPDAFILIKSVTEDFDFDRKRVMNSLDSIWFNLRDAKLLKEKREYIFQWTKDYSTKYYELSNGRYVITHVFYTNKRPYCLYANYSSKEDEEAIKGIVSSIEPHVNVINRVFLAFNNAPLYWIMFMIFMSFVGIVLKEEKEQGESIRKSIFITCITWGIIISILFVTTSGVISVFITAITISIILFLSAYFVGVYLTFDTD